MHLLLTFHYAWTALACIVIDKALKLDHIYNFILSVIYGKNFKRCVAFPLLYVKNEGGVFHTCIQL